MQFNWSSFKEYFSPYSLLSQAWMVTTEAEVKEMVQRMRDSEGPVLLEIRTRKGSRKTLGRPTTSPIENKSDLMHFLAIG